MTAASGADREHVCASCGLRGRHGRDCPASGADQPTLRDQLAAPTLARAFYIALHNGDGFDAARAWDDMGGSEPSEQRAAFEIAAAEVLPVVEAHTERAKAEGGAEALEQAAKIALPASGVRRLLLDRAAALRGST